MINDDITFRFKQFAMTDKNCGMKIGTDGVLAGVLAMNDEDPSRALNVADIGAGCGVIALMIAQRFPNAKVHAVEIDSGAASDLRTNVSMSPWKERISVTEGDYRCLYGEYDLIVSNPPYFDNGDISPFSSRATARHSGELSSESLIEYAANHLTEGGRAAIISPKEIVYKMISKAIVCNLEMWTRIDIATSQRRGITRTFIEFRRPKSGEEGMSVPTYKRINTWDDEYRKLTQDFYLNF